MIQNHRHKGRGDQAFLNNRIVQRIPSRGREKESPCKEQVTGVDKVTRTVDAFVSGRQDGDFIVDSGCTDPLFNDASFFTKLSLQKGSVGIGKRGASVEIKGKGEVRLYNKSGELVIFKRCYFVPDLPVT